MNTAQVSELRTKNQVTEAIRNGLSMITLDSGYISEEMLDKHIVEDDKFSPTYYNMIRRLLLNFNEDYDLPRIGWDDVDLYIQRLIKDGRVLFSEGDDGVIIYESVGDIINWSWLFRTIGNNNNIEIYIPSSDTLEYVYERFTKLEDVLYDLDINIHDLPLLFDEIIDDINYRFVHDLVVYQ